MTGVGYPQLSAVITRRAAHGLSGLICADGGCRTPGDVAKAFGGGADFVMLGGMLAGHEEWHELLNRRQKFAPTA
jgi:GMP reductase